MKTVIIFALLFAAACAVVFDEEASAFIQFQHKYKKSYEPVEFGKRFQIFKDNLKRAKELNEKEAGSATYGVTPFSDLSPEEFRTYYLMPKDLSKTEKPNADAFEIKEFVDLPTEYDWRNKGAVTPVYNQEQCGSCWAFSATETIESFNFLAGNKLTQFSMQQIVDCDTTAYGCGGGWTYSAYNYVENAGGIDTYTSYPYTAQNGQCAFKPNSVGAKVLSWKYVTKDEDENVMAQFVYQSGPVSVCVDAESWQNYQGGVISTCGQSVDHCVQVTGFSTQNGTPAWNVRNSWGAGWGENGYLYVARGNNVCAIAGTVTAVTANK